MTRKHRSKVSVTPKADHGAITPKLRRRRHGDVIRLEPVLEDGKEIAGAPKRARVASQTKLDRYRIRKCITGRQYDAGNDLYQLWIKCGQAQRVTSSYQPRITDSTKRKTAGQESALQAFHDALKAVGPKLSPVLMDVCIADLSAASWAASELGRADDGIVILRLALDALADHFGLPHS